MADPFLSEIRMMSFNFPPKGWAFCNGQSLAINQNQALFSLLGTTYGGNGQTTFQLPNLQGRVPIHMGNGHTLGETAGQNAVTVNIQQLPTHHHTLNGVSGSGTLAIAAGNLPAASASQMYQGPDANLVSMHPASVTNVGGSQPHENMQPYLSINFSIALQGIFPSR